MPSTSEDRITKAARLMLLLEMQEHGELKDKSLQQIADMFPHAPNRSTILRDLRVLDKLKKVRNRMRKYIEKSQE
jgi:hypothetical protein